MQFVKRNFELIVMFLIFLWAFICVHQSHKNTYLIKKGDLKELVIKDVVALKSMKNKSKKYPVSGIVILQDNNLHHFSAHCIGIDQFCNVKQITRFTDGATITLLWTKNQFDSSEYDIKSGLIKEIKTLKELYFKQKKSK